MYFLVLNKLVPVLFPLTSQIFQPFISVAPQVESRLEAGQAFRMSLRLQVFSYSTVSISAWHTIRWDGPSFSALDWRAPLAQDGVAGKKSHALCAEYDDLCAGSLFQEYEIDTIFDRPTFF